MTTFPQGAASVCLGGAPRQCYTAPRDFGKDISVDEIKLTKAASGLFFAASSGGGSGWEVHFALLVPGARTDLHDILDVTVSNQNQHAFWNEPTVSEAPIFVAANFVWGPGDSHYGPHRYIISTYAFNSAETFSAPRYYLHDRFMTVGQYDLDNANVLQSEKPEILARLERVAK
jgi:hypothetical protein